ncbi:MAG: carotenoid 1,2-hydratase [Pseudomonadota bacterium]
MPEIETAASSPSGPPVGFAAPVPPSGYRWWYLDGLSDDGRYGFVIIAFVGSVFSPYYFSARQRGATPAEDYTAINVCLYKPGGDRWSMTERSSKSLSRDSTHFQVAASRLEWRGDTLETVIDERSAPFGRRLRGSIRLVPQVINERRFELDRDGRHGWQPVAPVARVELRFEHPDLNFSGHGYLDSNDGSRMLELDFAYWNWSRSTADLQTTVYYVAEHPGGHSKALALRFSERAGCDEVALPAAQPLRRSGWRIDRVARDDAPLAIVRDLEDTPFYSRTLLETGGGPARFCMHESLDMRRFKQAWVRTLLPFRMPRRG